jgi:hypothetical protein
VGLLFSCFGLSLGNAEWAAKNGHFSQKEFAPMGRHVPPYAIRFIRKNGHFP